MSESAVLTVRLPAQTKDRLAILAESTRRTSSFLAAEAIASYVECELAIVEGIERGLADIEAGRIVPHAEAAAAFKTAIKVARAKR